MNALLALAAVSEATTGLVLLLYPSIVASLLFGSEIMGAGIVMSRLAGISLIALGIACWPGNMAYRALYGMVTFSTLAMLYLAYVGLIGVVGFCYGQPLPFTEVCLSFSFERGGKNKNCRHQERKRPSVPRAAPAPDAKYFGTFTLEPITRNGRAAHVAHVKVISPELKQWREQMVPGPGSRRSLLRVLLANSGLSA
jgi:hypothetical protein